MNLVNATLGGTPERPTVSFAEHTIAIDQRAVERYPKVADRIGGPVIVGLRPEHFVMEGDADLPADQMLHLHVDLAEAMGAEVHLHTTLDVPPVELEGAPVAAEDGDEVIDSITR
jgi:ABC-type sugar transport system ATPase subunit